MHQTTVRFGPDLWAALVSESIRSGVSVAQYVRDAAMARLALAVDRDRGLEQRGFPAPSAAGGDPVRPGEGIGAQLGSAEAVRAQGQLARARAKRLRSETQELRRQTLGGSR
jgi:hypothetical protein